MHRTKSIQLFHDAMPAENIDQNANYRWSLFIRQALRRLIVPS